MHHFSPLFQMGPARRDHIPAFRVALGVAIAMFTMLALGRLKLAIYANFGAFTGVYSFGIPFQGPLSDLVLM